MFKKIVSFTLLSAAFAGISTSAIADEASVKKAVEAAYPKFKVESVAKTPYAGLYEVFMGGQIIYTDEKMSFLIAEGHLVDPKTKKDITGERMEELTKIDFSTLPLDQAIKVVKGNGSRKLVVFSDVDCPYCKRLEKDLANVTDVTIYTFLYPIPSLHPDAARKSKAIWCAPNRQKAWDDYMLRGVLAADKSCDSPIDEIQAVGQKYKMNGTPTLVFADGRVVPGAISTSDMETYLNGK